MAVRAPTRVHVVADGNTLGSISKSYGVSVDAILKANHLVTIPAYLGHFEIRQLPEAFKPTSPPPGRTQPPCVKTTTPWQGKIRVVKNGVITNTTIK